MLVVMLARRSFSGAGMIMLVVVMSGIAAVMIMAIAIMFVMMVMFILGAQKIRLVLQDFIQIEAAEAENLVERHFAPFGADDFGEAVDAADHALDAFQLVGADQIGFVEQDNIGKGDLFFRLVRIFQPLR